MTREPKKHRTPSRAAAAKASGARGQAPAAVVPAPTYDDLLAIVRLIESGSRFSEFRLRSGDIEVEIRRADDTTHAPAAANVHAAAPVADAVPAPAVAKASSATRAAGGNKALPDLPPGTAIVRSPMVGTFYRAPEPGAAPFVTKGSRVAADTIVCIVEVMKLMNSIEAGVAGVVTHVFVEDAGPVEFGQPLVAIRPGS